MQILNLNLIWHLNLILSVIGKGQFSWAAREGPEKTSHAQRTLRHKWRQSNKYLKQTFRKFLFLTNSCCLLFMLPRSMTGPQHCSILFHSPLENLQCQNINSKDLNQEMKMQLSFTHVSTVILCRRSDVEKYTFSNDTLLADMKTRKQTN